MNLKAPLWEVKTYLKGALPPGQARDRFVLEELERNASSTVTPCQYGQKRMRRDEAAFECVSCWIARIPAGALVPDFELGEVKIELERTDGHEITCAV